MALSPLSPSTSSIGTSSTATPTTDSTSPTSLSDKVKADLLKSHKERAPGANFNDFGFNNSDAKSPTGSPTGSTTAQAHLDAANKPKYA